MMLYDSGVDSVKYTKPLFADNGYTFCVLFLLVSATLMVLCMIQVEHIVDAILSGQNGVGRRMTARFSNREWNQAIVQFCADNGLGVPYDGRDMVICGYTLKNDVEIA